MKSTLRHPASWAIGALVLVAALLVAPGAIGRSQAEPENTAPPFISGPYLVEVGTTLQGHQGDWTGPHISYVYAWQRCDPDGTSCQKIEGEKKTSYTVKKADVGHSLRFHVTAKNADGDTIARSEPTQEIRQTAQEPGATAAPTISGTATVGEKLTGSRGTWQGTQPITYTYAWEICTLDLASCVLSGVTGQTYTVPKSDVGKRIRLRVTGKNSAGSTAAHSLPTPAVKAETPSGGGGGGGGGNSNVIPVSDVGPAGDRLIVDSVTFNPNPVTTTSKPIIVKIRVTNTKGKLVQGALVFFRSTPVVASIPTDAPTGADGTVTYSIQPRSDFPIKNGYSVQFFVKAYKQGDPTLAGISGTRLVQVATHKP
jgi:hypothetical protein